VFFPLIKKAYWVIGGYIVTMYYNVNTVIKFRIFEQIQTTNRRGNMAFPHDGKKIPKGVSGNPSGRPKGSLNRSTLYRKFLDLEESFTNPITGQAEEMSLGERLALTVILKGLDGDLNATKEALDSGYGKVPDKIIEAGRERSLVIITTDKDIEPEPDTEPE